MNPDEGNLIIPARVLLSVGDRIPILLKFIIGEILKKSLESYRKIADAQPPNIARKGSQPQEKPLHQKYKHRLYLGCGTDEVRSSRFSQALRGGQMLLKSS